MATKARKAETYRCARRNRLRKAGELRYWHLTVWGVYGKAGSDEAVRYCDERTIEQLRRDEKRRMKILATPNPQCEVMRGIRALRGVGRPVRA